MQHDTASPSGRQGTRAPDTTCSKKEQEGRKDLIRAVIYVERQSQKAILIGKGGEALKRLGSRAREKIERFLERPVYLELWVKVKDAWRKDEQFIRESFRGQ
jgi:GTP-binding protein Era